jgi:hypothetical protein
MLDCEIALSIFRKRQENIMLDIEMLLSEDSMFTIADNGLGIAEVVGIELLMLKFSTNAQ